MIGNYCVCSIDNLKQCSYLKCSYLKMCVMATRWLSPFSGVARACAHAQMIFTTVSKRDAVSKGAMYVWRYVSFSEIHVLYTNIVPDILREFAHNHSSFRQPLSFWAFELIVLPDNWRKFH